LQSDYLPGSMQIFTLGHILIMGSNDCAVCSVDSYRMHGQGSIPGETAWNVVLTGTSIMFLSYSVDCSRLSRLKRAP
jgi:hypothetical protein